MIDFKEFKKLDLRVAKIIKADRVEGSEKLLKLQIDLGDEERQLIAGIAKFYPADELIGREIIIVANLEPKIIFSLESQGMLLAAKEEESGRPVLLMPDRMVSPGSRIT